MITLRENFKRKLNDSLRTRISTILRKIHHHYHYCNHLCHYHCYYDLSLIMFTCDNVLYLLACNINDFFALFVFNVRLKNVFFYQQFFNLIPSLVYHYSVIDIIYFSCKCIYYAYAKRFAIFQYPATKASLSFAPALHNHWYIDTRSLFPGHTLRSSE